jgi:DNA-binding response OmpR family regulator
MTLVMGCGTLLVIDDEPAITALIRRIAESMGYEVVATSDPDVFKQQVRNDPPDLICIDLAMPQVDGIELMRFLASERSQSKLLIMSGSEPGLLHSALRLGEALGLPIAGTVPKPLRMDAMKALLSDLCRG